MSSEQKTKTCKHCKTDIPKGVKVCPNCGKKQGGILKWVIIVIIVLGIIGAAMGGGDKKDNGSQKAEDKGNKTETTVQNEKQKNEEQKNEEPDVPKEYQSALEKAQQYCDTMYMSKQGIYDQLTSEYGEKFSPEAAQYAVDHLQADYKKNALEKAKQYQEEMSMSPEAIRDQLTSEYGEKFTLEEADYAIENLSK